MRKAKPTHHRRKDHAIGIGTILAGILIFAFAWHYPRPSSDRDLLATTPVQTVTNVPATPVIPVSFTEIVHGSKSSISERVNYLITSSDELKGLWRLVDATSSVPEVDFDKRVVVALFAGAKPTAGYSIGVAAVADGAARSVKVSLTKPAPDCKLAEVTTAPYQIGWVPKTSLRFTHEDAVATVACK